MSGAGLACARVRFPQGGARTGTVCRQARACRRDRWASTLPAKKKACANLKTVRLLAHQMSRGVVLITSSMSKGPLPSGRRSRASRAASGSSTKSGRPACPPRRSFRRSSALARASRSSWSRKSLRRSGRRWHCISTAFHAPSSGVRILARRIWLKPCLHRWRTAAGAASPTKSLRSYPLPPVRMSGSSR